jgi:hypothetical protein
MIQLMNKPSLFHNQGQENARLDSHSARPSVIIESELGLSSRWRDNNPA